MPRPLPADDGSVVREHVDAEQADRFERMLHERMDADVELRRQWSYRSKK